MSHPYWPYAIDADEAPPLDADRLILVARSAPVANHPGGRALRGAVDAVHRPGPSGHRQGDRRAGGARPAGAVPLVRRHHGPGPAQRRHHQRPALVRRAQLADRVVPHRRRHRARGPPGRPGAHPADAGRRGRHQLRERLLADGQHLRRHRPVRRRHRQLRRRVDHPAAGLGAARRDHARRRAAAARVPDPGHAPAAAASGGPAARGRPAHLARRRHRRRPAGAARHRRRGHLPDPVRRAVRPGAWRGGAAVRHPGDARRRPGAPARRLRRHRDRGRRPPGRRGRDHARASSSRSTATRPSSPCRCAPRPSSSTS